MHWKDYEQNEDSWMTEDDIHEDLVTDYQRRIEGERTG